ncbi:1193_t:CDS:2 [Dentiscutata erythropus]|uniref:1193_t:CDS:1 n=1 Tax=Dentiscutata erythropus TaxID=1348616 RepID=A0A9N9C603_9GLOM|nr:1193_t:CDS:2 [Dentiscutata erythropus]
MRKMMNIYFLLQIQNNKDNIIPGGTNLLSLPISTTTSSIRSEYGLYINDHAGKQFITAIARIVEEATLDELRFMHQENISPNNLPLFIREFAINTVANIKLRFSDHAIINLFKIFDPKQLPTDRYLISVYGNYEIAEIGKFYRTSKKTTGSKNFY